MSRVARTIAFKTRSARSILRKVGDRLRQDGISAAGSEALDSASRLFRWYSPKRVWRRSRRSEFDRQHNVDTSGVVHPSSLGEGESEFEAAQYYKAVADTEVSAAMAKLPIDPAEFVFIDYGSGKGKALFLASLYPFKRIIGIELSRQLHEAAVKNLETFRHPGQACFDLQALLANATTYDPPAKPCVLFLYNPFDYSIFDLVLNWVLASRRAAPRDIWILYVNPRAHPQIEARNDIAVEEYSDRLAIYRVV